jgi:hypothetical protein
MEPGQTEFENSNSALVEQELRQMADRLGLDEKNLVLGQAKWFALEHADLLIDSAQALQNGGQQVEAQLRWILAENPQLPKVEDSQLGEARVLRLTLATLAASKIEDRYKLEEAGLPTAKTGRGNQLNAAQLVDGVVTGLSSRASNG